MIIYILTKNVQANYDDYHFWIEKRDQSYHTSREGAEAELAKRIQQDYASCTYHSTDQQAMHDHRVRLMDNKTIFTGPHDEDYIDDIYFIREQIVLP